MSEIPNLTDCRARALHQKRAARSPVGFLFDDIASEIEERLDEVNKSFTSPAFVGQKLLCDRLPKTKWQYQPEASRLNFERQAHDLLVHGWALHWADDPVGQIVQSRLALKPDGLFLAVMPGGQTLHELRSSLAEAETRLTGGLSPRVLPMADVRDLGGALQRAGLALPVADSRRLTIRYPSLAALVSDLRGMGETNAMASRLKSAPSREFFRLTESIYRSKFADNDGYLHATVDLVFLTGWAPDESQPKPLRPGSAGARLADALGTTETPLGESAAPRKR